MAESPENEHPRKVFGWAARDASGYLSPFHFSRRATEENDVRLKVLYCGLCHSDLNHITLGDDGYFGADYPVVPGGLTVDGIIDAVSVPHSLSTLVDLLKARGKLIMLFCPDPPLELPLSSLTRGSKVIAGHRCIGGMKEMQEMINFEAEHDIKADVEVIPMDYINRAMDRLGRGDVKYRFVIDIGNTLKSTSKNSPDEESDEEPPDQPCDSFEEEPLVERTKKVGHRKKNTKEKSSQKLSVPSRRR